MRIRAEEQPIVADGGASVEDAAVAGKGILSELLELGFCVYHKCARVAAHGNNLSINYNG